jgi:hypothetical protein
MRARRARSPYDRACMQSDEYDALIDDPLAFLDSVWMHGGRVPFVAPAQSDSHHGPTLRPIVEELWRHGHQTPIYAAGDWSHHLHRFAERPAHSIVHHVDRGDLAAVHRELGHKFCLSGGIPKYLLAPARRRKCGRPARK